MPKKRIGENTVHTNRDHNALYLLQEAAYRKMLQPDLCT